jgi:hypothetical protein
MGTSERVDAVNAGGHSAVFRGRRGTPKGKDGACIADLAMASLFKTLGAKAGVRRARCEGFR